MYCAAFAAARSPVAVATASAAQTRSVRFFDNAGKHTHFAPTPSAQNRLMRNGRSL